MKLLRISTRLFLGIVSIFFLAGCGGASGGLGNGVSPEDLQGAAGPIGLSLNRTGGINLSADLLRAQGIDVGYLTRSNWRN